MNRTHRPVPCLLATAALAFSLSVCGLLVVAGDAKDKFWDEKLRSTFYGDRPIQESGEIIELTAPKRAEDAAVVPISIEAKIPQSDERFIKTITLIIDRNPVPFAGRFHFTQASGRADLAMRIRVNAYTPVRAVAELNTGELHMSRRFVKASGGCSAPPGTDMKAAMQRIGNMKLTVDQEKPAAGSIMAQLRISHPNMTGMQMDQVSRLYIPPHFIKEMAVSFDGVPVMTAETDIAMSENPSFRFFFVPDRKGMLLAKITDSKGLSFEQSYEVDGTPNAQQ